MHANRRVSLGGKLIFFNYGEFKTILRLRMVFTKYNLKVFELHLLLSSHLKMELN